MVQPDPDLTARLSGWLVPRGCPGDPILPGGHPSQHLPCFQGAKHQPFASLLLPCSSIYFHY